VRLPDGSEVLAELTLEQLPLTGSTVHAIERRYANGDTRYFVEKAVVGLSP
jgi:hypothetical protein